MLLGQSAICNKVWAVWGRQSVHWKSLRKWARFQTPPKVRIWSLLKTATRFFALLATAPLFRTHRSRHGLHGVVAAFWLSVFASVFVPVAFSYSLSSQLSFWHHNNETASVAAVLETINLRECTQLFVNRTFLITFLNGTDVCAQATPVIEFLKHDGSWGHTPPIENMLCKALSNYLLWEFKIYTCISTLYTTHVDMALCTCWYFNRVEKLLNLSLLPKLQIHNLDECHSSRQWSWWYITHLHSIVAVSLDAHAVCVHLTQVIDGMQVACRSWKKWVSDEQPVVIILVQVAWVLAETGRCYSFLLECMVHGLKCSVKEWVSCWKLPYLEVI